MSTLTSSSTPAAVSGTTRRGPRLSGLTWLVWRQHRAAFWTGLAVTVVGIAWFAHQRAGLLTYLDGVGRGEAASGAAGFQLHESRLSDTSTLLGLLMPILVGVFLGAPLIAHDLEHGTGKLVFSQSVSRRRWLATKLGLAVLVVTVCTTALSTAFSWWLGPVSDESGVLHWVVGGATGPVPVALSLLTLVAGVAIGMVLRRTLLSMVATFAFAIAVQVLWAYRWMSLGTVSTATTDDGVGEGMFPELPQGAYDLDQSYVTGSGEQLGWGSCARQQTEQATTACLERNDVVGWAVDYLAPSELAPVLWTGSAILLALTAAVAVFVFWWGGKRLY